MNFILFLIHYRTKKRYIPRYPQYFHIIIIYYCTYSIGAVAEDTVDVKLDDGLLSDVVVAAGGESSTLLPDTRPVTGGFPSAFLNLVDFTCLDR